MRFEDLIHSNDIYLYLGDLPVQRRTYTNKNFIGLSLNKNDQYHIKHDVVKHISLNDNTVNIVQSEDVMEHIEYHLLKDPINEIYRILKPGGLFRLSMPDYSCDILYNRSKKDENGNLIFDSGGGGTYDEINKKVGGGGHVWFPNFSSVKSLLETTDFLNEKINYLHYYDMDNNPVTNKIDYNNGFISRTPDNDVRVQSPYRPMSIIVDCYK
jgi:hypothetical protein